MRRIRHTGPAVLALALVAATMTPVAAQRGILGVKGGVGVHGLRGLDDTLDSDNQTGWSFGVFSTNGQGVISLQSELNLDQTKFSVTNGTTTTDVDLKFLQPAVLLKLGIPLVSLRPSAFGGVGYSFKVSCDYGDADCDDTFEPKNQWMGVFGVDLEIWLGSLAIVGDARYNLGFSEISGASSVFEDVKSKAWVLRAGLGWRH